MKTTRLMQLMAGAIACLWLAATTSATAQPPAGARGGPGRGGPPDPQQILQRFDKNEDGQLSKDEVPEVAWGRLSRADADNDGVVTKDELAAMPRPGREGVGRSRGDGPPDNEQAANNDEGGDQAGPPDARRGGRGFGPGFGRGFGPGFRPGRSGPGARQFGASSDKDSQAGQDSAQEDRAEAAPQRRGPRPGADRSASNRPRRPRGVKNGPRPGVRGSLAQRDGFRPDEAAPGVGRGAWGGRGPAGLAGFGRNSRGGRGPGGFAWHQGRGSHMGPNAWQGRGRMQRFGAPPFAYRDQAARRGAGHRSLSDQGKGRHRGPQRAWARGPRGMGRSGAPGRQGPGFRGPGPWRDMPSLRGHGMQGRGMQRGMRGPMMRGQGWGPRAGGGPPWMQQGRGAGRGPQGMRPGERFGSMAGPPWAERGPQARGPRGDRPRGMGPRDGGPGRMGPRGTGPRGFGPPGFDGPRGPRSERETEPQDGE